MKKSYFVSRAWYAFGFLFGTYVTIIILNAFPGKTISKDRFWFVVAYGISFAVASVVFWLLSKKSKT